MNVYECIGEASNSRPLGAKVKPDTPVKVLAVHQTAAILPSQNHTQSSWTMLSHQNNKHYEESNYFHSVSITDRTINCL